jgi:DNA replication protein DnaC
MPMEYWTPPDHSKGAREAWNPMPPATMLERALDWLTPTGDMRGRTVDGAVRASAQAAKKTLALLPEWPKTQTVTARRARMAPVFVAPAEEFEPDSTGNLLLAGPTGTGKTLAAVHAVLLLWQRRIAEYRPLPKVLFVKHTQLATARRNSRLGQESQLIEDAIGAELLVVDDLGQADDRDPALFEVIDARYDVGRPTIATTGLNTAEFKERIGETVLRRLLQAKRAGRLVSTFSKPKLQAVPGGR